MQLKEGKYHIEDMHTAVEVNLDEAAQMPGLFTESCFVLAQGELIDDVFHVSELA